jgi:hypothetical protein
MMLDRRTFLGTTLGATAAAAVANFLSRLSTVQAHASPLDPLRTADQIAGGKGRNCVAFKIDGWDRCDDIAIDGPKIASADLVTDDPARDLVLIKMNQSWRTVWR